jgi:hypothetical protein
MRLVRRTAVAALVLTTAVITTGAPAFAAPPSNDTYAGRQVVSIGFSDTVDTSEATTDADDAAMNATCGAPATDASVWYEITPASDGGIAVDVSESSYSAGVLVATGNPTDGFQIVTCAPGAAGWFAQAGETYAVLAIDDQFDGGGNGGTLRINVTEIPPPPEIDVTVNRFGTFNSKTGSATISGTVTCTGDAQFAGLDTEVRQNVGRFTITGFGFTEVFCDGATRPWTLEVTPFNGKFAGGKAVSVTFAFACGFFDCGIDFEERIVQLRGKR